jgi:hypothetical protein
MKHIAGQTLRASLVALSVSFALFGLASAQEQTAPPLGGGGGAGNAGLIIGMVARCINGVETPAPQVSVGVEGGSASLAKTDSAGLFFLALPAGQYTVVAAGDDGTTANRYYVPVESGQALDIGVLDLGAGLAGCGPDSALIAPILPTMVVTTVPPPPTPTPVPSEPAPAPPAQETAPAAPAPETATPAAE